jgi:hypothetical protein
VRTNHVHIVVYANQAPERVMTDFKAYASRKLNAGGFDGPERKRWTRHGSTRYLWHANHIEAAIRYVVHEQGEALVVYENTERTVSQPPVATGGAVKEMTGKYVARVTVDELPMLQIEDVEPPNPDREGGAHSSSAAYPSPDREGGQLSLGAASSLTVAAQPASSLLAAGASAQGIVYRMRHSVRLPARMRAPESPCGSQKTDHEPRWQDKNCRNPSNRTKGPFGVAAHVDGSARRVVMQHAPRAARFTKAMGTSQLEDRGDRSLRFCSRMAV